MEFWVRRSSLSLNKGESSDFFQFTWKMWHRHILIYQSGYCRSKFTCGGFQEFRSLRDLDFSAIKAASFPMVNFLDKRFYLTRYFIEVKWNILLFIAVYIFHAFVVFVYLKNFVKAFFSRLGTRVFNSHGHSSNAVIKYVTDGGGAFMILPFCCTVTLFRGSVILSAKKGMIVFQYCVGFFLQSFCYYISPKSIFS